VAFWQEVGAVELVGMHPAWPDGLDPLVVYPPEGALSFLFDEEEDEGETEGTGRFLAMAACNPETKRVWKPSTKVNLHEWLEVKLIEENIGLAGVRVEGIIYDVEFTAAYHLPLGGLDLSNGYTLEDNFKFGQSSQGQWRLSGVYAVNPTLQNMISVEGLPLHFHGYDPESRYGGHITQALVSSETVISVWPLKDLLVQIKNLDRAWLPVRELGE
jgi:hypothetical protein